jgi:hypothetical protein
MADCSPTPLKIPTYGRTTVWAGLDAALSKEELALTIWKHVPNFFIHLR